MPPLQSITYLSTYALYAGKNVMIVNCVGIYYSFTFRNYGGQRNHDKYWNYGEPKILGPNK